MELNACSLSVLGMGGFWKVNAPYADFMIHAQIRNAMG
jgi:hypothetical protein